MFALLSMAIILFASTNVNAAPKPQLSPYASISTIAPEVRVNNPDGSYVYSFETSDGTKKNEEGKLKDIPPSEDSQGGPAVVASGTYFFVLPNGSSQKVDYVADELGFRPVIQYSSG